jgi:hypothetical protein
MAWFRLAGGGIVAAWIIEDTGRLLRKLGAPPDAPV